MAENNIIHSRCKNVCFYTGLMEVVDVGKNTKG